MTDTDVVIRDDPEQDAYVVQVNGEPAGRAEYRTRRGTRVFVHTEVDDRYSGRGVGGRLVRHALEDVKARGIAIVPLCPFFAAYIDRHPEYEDLVDRELTSMYRSRSQDSD